MFIYSQQLIQILRKVIIRVLAISVRGNTSESDAYRRQILTPKVDPRTEKVNYL